MPTCGPGCSTKHHVAIAQIHRIAANIDPLPNNLQFTELLHRVAGIWIGVVVEWPVARMRHHNESASVEERSVRVSITSFNKTCDLPWMMRLSPFAP